MAIKRASQSESTRPVSRFTIAACVYIVGGVLGSLAIYGRVPSVQKASYNIIDYFSGSFQAPTIGFLTFFYLFMLFPIFPFVSKNQVMELIPKRKRQAVPRINLKLTCVYGLLWLGVNALFILQEIEPTTVIGFVSIITGFYIAYCVPVLMTLKTVSYEREDKSNQLEGSLIIPDEEINQCDGAKSIKSTEPSEVSRSSFEGEINSSKVKRRPRLTRWQRVLYWSVLTFGCILFVTEVIFFIL